MNNKFTLKYFFRHSKYLSAVIIFLLLSISVNSIGYEPTIYKINTIKGLHKNESEPRMFLITVVDSNDDSIGKRCETDLDNITFAFQDLADWLGVKLEDPKIIEGDQFSKAAVNSAIGNWLKSQEPGRNDIVVFYYSGHGFRLPDDKSEYPRMWLKTATDKNPETTNLRIEQDIYDPLLKMGAGVTMVLSDCCNTTDAKDDADFDNVMVPNRDKVTHKREHHRQQESNNRDDFDNADKLFIPEHPLSILATAAGKSEFAGGKADVGGFFTNYFLEALTKCIYDFNLQPTWENIFKYTDDNASYWAKSAECPQATHNEQGRCVQTLRYKLENGE